MPAFLKINEEKQRKTEILRVFCGFFVLFGVPCRMFVNNDDF